MVKAARTKQVQSKLAYSYARFSTSDQEDGDSLRRQTEQTGLYAESHGFKLVELPADKGKSGFHGAHLNGGHLGKFVARVQAGEVPAGSALIVEEQSRLGRMPIEKQASLMFLLLEAGIEIHIVREQLQFIPGRMELVQILVALLAMEKSHIDSKTKSINSKTWWKHTREDIQNAKNPVAHSGIGPCWLIVERGKPIVPNKDRCRVLKRIFVEASNGLGAQSIANKLSDEKVPAWNARFTTEKNARWHQAYINRILTDRRVLGEHRPGTIERVNGKRKWVQNGEVWKNYYPIVIDIELFNKVQTLRRIVEQVRFGAVKRLREPWNSLGNLFQGLVVDAETGRPLYYQKDPKKLKDGTTKYYERLRVGLGKELHTLKYREFEDTVLAHLAEEEWDSVKRTANKNVKQQKSELETLQKHLSDAEKIRKRYEKLADDPNSNFDIVQSKFVAALQKEQELKSKIDALSVKSDDVQFIVSIENNMAELPTLDKPEDRIKMRAKIAGLVEKILVFFDTEGPVITLKYRGGATRQFPLAKFDKAVFKE